ncbi:MAG: T9SS type A sorting domain-containing protein [Bacteroidota bacterium]
MNFKCFSSTLLLPLCLCLNFGISSQTDDIRSFIFGHSLINHALPIVPTPSQETTVPFWLSELAQEAGKTYAATGQYGFLPQHANLPPVANWGFDNVPFVWDSEQSEFSAANFNNILLTAGNFIQWQGPSEAYPGESFTPISLTSDILQWVNQQTPGIQTYIYENWPDMAGFAGQGFPLSASAFADYNDYTRGDFHQWWIDYQDALTAAHPNLPLKMIPVGPILADLLEQTALSSIPLSELYEDDAPHGRATIYFLASLITYMATYEEQAPTSYPIPSTVHATVATHYSTVVDFIWDALLDFNFPNGESRVFFNAVLPVRWDAFHIERQAERARLQWTTSYEENNAGFQIEHSTNGQTFMPIGEVAAGRTPTRPQHYEFTHQPTVKGQHFYRIKQMDYDGVFSYSPTQQISWSDRPFSARVFPNPIRTSQVQLSLTSASQLPVQLRLIDLAGRTQWEQTSYLTSGQANLLLAFPALPNGLYTLQIKQGERYEQVRLLYLLP